MSAHIEEIHDEDDVNQQKHEGDDDPSGDEANGEMMAAAEPGPSSTTSKGKKNKKKKKSKASKADNIPQEVVDLVVNEVRHVILLALTPARSVSLIIKIHICRQKHGASEVENLDEAHVRMALDRLRIMDVLKGKSGIGGKNRKEMGEHKFWATQPVPQLGAYLFTWNVFGYVFISR
jgi:glycylpeptide N-tetradecanoyltransferase